MSEQQPQPATTHRILVLHPTDNSAVALTPLASGEELATPRGGIKVLADIPAGHKIALDNIPAGGNAIKYGEVIGVATTNIQRGEHVHIHNLVGLRVGQEVSQ